MEASQHSILSESALISVRIISMDYYLSTPSTDTTNQYDPIYSVFRSSPVKTIPVIRVFGTTPAGQKACLHIHGIFPYLYAPLQGNQPGYLYRLAASLDKAINITLFGSGSDQQSAKTGTENVDKENNSSQQHVYKIVEVSGRPYYGFHSKEHRFAKIYLYNPHLLKRAADLLVSGAIMGQILQPHYAHIPYVLQFMMDYNLQGMSFVHLKTAKFRHSHPFANYSLGSKWEGSSQRSRQRVYKVEEMTPNMLAPDSLPMTTVCDVECDAVACDITNSNNDLSSTLGSEDLKKSGNPGLDHIWEDEKLRRSLLKISFKKHPLTPPSSPPRSMPADDQVTDSQKYWGQKFAEVIDEWIDKATQEGRHAKNDKNDEQLPKKKVFVFPDEVADDTLLQAATKVEDHLASLSLSFQESSGFAKSHEMTPEESEKKAYFEDTFVDEKSVIELLGNETLNSKESQVLDSDDEELIELLHELKKTNECQPSTSHQALQKVTKSCSSSQSTLLSSQFSQKEREKYEQEIADTLEMSQICWDQDPFADDIQEEETEENADEFDNESFWETYNFESVLK